MGIMRTLGLIAALLLGLVLKARADIRVFQDDSTTLANWRTDAPTNIDADRKYGTDGYLLYGWNVGAGNYLTEYDARTENPDNLWARPPYIAWVECKSSTRLWSGSQDGNYGKLQNPADPSSPLHQAAVLLGERGGPSDVITLGIHRATPEAFTLTLIIGGGDGNNNTSDRQTITVVSQGLPINFEHQGLPATNGVSYKSFVIGAGTGDFEVTVNGGGDGDNTHLTGLAFDPVTEPRPTIDIAGGDGVKVIWMGGTLHMASTIVGPWTEVPNANSPHQVNPDGHAFYRCKTAAGIWSSIVGCVTVPIVANTVYQLATQLSPFDFFGSQPTDQLFTYHGGFTAYNFDDIDPAWLPDYPFDDLSLGEGFVYRSLFSGSRIFIGKVPQGTSSVALLQNQLQLVSSPLPQAGLLSTDLGYPATDADRIYVWSGSRYDIYYYTTLCGWQPSEPRIDIGQGFWVLRSSPGSSWTRTFTGDVSR